MNLENKRFKAYSYALILGACVIVGTLGVWFLIVSPLYKTTQRAGTELTTKENKYSELTNKKDRLDELKDKEVELKKQAEIVSNALPKEEEIGRLFIQLDGLVRTSNGKLKSVSKSTSVSDTGNTSNLDSAGIVKTVYSLPLDLPTYYDLKSFILNSSSALRLFSINDFNITATDAGALTVNLTANSYTRK